MTPNLARIVERFRSTPDPRRRYNQLLEYAERLETSAGLLTPENKVPSAALYSLTTVHIAAALKDGKVYYQADADVPFVKNLIGFLVEGLNGYTPQEIANVTTDFIKDSGLAIQLTPVRFYEFEELFRVMQRKAAALVQDEKD